MAEKKRETVIQIRRRQLTAAVKAANPGRDKALARIARSKFDEKHGEEKTRAKK